MRPRTNGDETGLAHALRAFRGDDRPDAGQAFVHLVVDEHIFIFGPVADLVRRALHPIGDHLRRIRASVAQALLELGHRRRQQEDRDQLSLEIRLQLAGALPVDVEQYVAALAQRILHRRLGVP